MTTKFLGRGGFSAMIYFALIHSGCGSSPAQTTASASGGSSATTYGTGGALGGDTTVANGGAPVSEQGGRGTSLPEGGTAPTSSRSSQVSGGAAPTSSELSLVTGGTTAVLGQGGSSHVATTMGSTGGVPANPGGSPATGGTHPGSTLAVSAGYLHVQGSRLLDDAGHEVRLTGVNWFGFETSNLSPHGLWARDYRSMLKQIQALGFNTVRLPWCDAMLKPGATAKSLNTYGADPYDGTDPINAPLADKTPIEMMDLVVKAAGDVGLKLILDNHSRNPDGYMEEKVWYTSSVSEEQWIANWKAVAERYRGNPTVVGFDLDNEPHGEASWASGNAGTDWNAAAERCGNAILQVNPDALIIVEGVEKVGTDGYWWGGNLTGVRKNPIVLSKPDKLVYSAHEYGPEVHEQPWFSTSDFPSNLPAIWNDHFGFIMQGQLGHVLIGEFGIKDPKAASGRADTWFKEFLKYSGSTYSWTFWCWNPNSGDTEGILEYDWVTPKQWKLDALKPHLAPQFK